MSTHGDRAEHEHTEYEDESVQASHTLTRPDGRFQLYFRQRIRADDRLPDEDDRRPRLASCATNELLLQRVARHHPDGAARYHGLTQHSVIAHGVDEYRVRHGLPVRRRNRIDIQ